MSIQNPWSELRTLITDAIKDKLNLDVKLEEPDKEEFGDFAFACFGLAKQFQRAPNEIAAELVGKINIIGIHTKAIGPYVNFYVDWTVWADKILKSVDTKYGLFSKLNKTVVIDFSSPNPAHPFHMGTVRSTITGESVSRILESQGYSVKRVCYINDLGRQAAVALLGYMTYAKGKQPSGKADMWLGKIYFKAHAASEGSPTMQERIEQTLRECEKGTKGYADLSKRVFDWCISGFKQNWNTMGIKFDKIVFESQFIKRSKELVGKLKADGHTLESDGATVLNLESYGLPSTIVLRSDGTALYLPRDLAFALWRCELWKPARNIYVVAEDQKLHFQQLFKTLELLGYPVLAKCSHHLAYSMVLLEGKKMSARSGHVVLWDELLEEGTSKIMKHMQLEKGEPEWKAKLKETWAKMPEHKRLAQAQANALAAIKYFILRYSPEKPVDFHWDAALALEGDTGPYLQYTHARAGSILSKAKKVKAIKRIAASEKSENAVSLYESKQEKIILQLLARYPDVLRKAADDLRPHYLVGYLFSLADAFNKFYEAVPVLKTDTRVRKERLKMVKAVKFVLANGLNLLGIDAPERM